MLGNTAVRLLTTSFLVFASVGLAEPKFKDNPTLLSAAVNSPFKVELRPLLSNMGKGNLKFALGSNAPKWLTIDTQNRMTALPQAPDVGTKKFLLSVRDDKVIVYTAIHLNVAAKLADKISFKTNPVEIIVKANINHVVDLNTLVNQEGPTPTVWTPNNELPSWGTVNSAAATMTLFPKSNNGGKHSFKMTVSKGEASVLLHPFNVTVTSPPVWSNDPVDLGIQNEDVEWELNLNTKISNPAGGNVTFTAVNLPDWMTLTNTGLLKGTPRRKDVGDYGFGSQPPVKPDLAFTATGTGGGSSVKAKGTVLITLKPPKWIGTTLPDAFEDASYSQDLRSQMQIFEPGTPNCTSVSVPAWLKLSTDCILSGIPGKANLGPQQVKVGLTQTVSGKVLDGGTGTLSFKVIHVNHPPRWKKNPLNLVDGATKKLYEQDLKGSFEDPDLPNDSHTCEIVGQPHWAKVTSNCIFTGTPDKAGTFSWVVRVKDAANASDETTVIINIKKTNEPPYWISKPTLLPGAQEDAYYTEGLKKYVVDPDGDEVFFTLLLAKQDPAWAKVSNGFLSGTPKAEDLGLNKFHITVTDNISGADTSEVQVFVAHTNHPPMWTLKPLVFEANEDEPFSRDISIYAIDPDTARHGDKLTFDIVSFSPATANWLSISTNGTLSGKPTHTNEGTNNYVVKVADDKGGSANVDLIVNVKHKNHAPYWTQDPIQLPKGKEGVGYSQSIAAFAKDPDIPVPGDRLTFTKVSNSGPAWINVSQDGVVSGTPGRNDTGLNKFKARVMDAAGLFAIVNVEVDIERVNKPPYWRQSPILLTDALEDMLYSFDLKPYAADDDGDDLTFRLVNGPSWMTVSKDGIVMGTPGKEHLGNYTAEFAVSDGALEATTPAKGRVLHRNHKPVIKDLSFKVGVNKPFSVNLNDPKYVYDPDANDKLNFSPLTPNSDWIRVSSLGVLSAEALCKHLGNHTFTLRVDDGELSAEGPVKIEVVREPVAPAWTANPITGLKAKTGELFTGSVAGYVVNKDCVPAILSKKVGPSWLDVDSSGNLRGTPKASDLGENRFTLEAKVETLTAETVLVILVEPGTHTDKLQVDKKVDNAPSENLWVVDNSSHCDSLIRALKSNIHIFYDELTAAKIKHAAIFLSADADKFDGSPIWFTNESMLIQRSPDPTQDFLRRLDKAYSSGHCFNCFNSPIWSMFRFYERLPGLSVYRNGYFMEKVPMDTMIVTQQRDHFRRFSKHTPQKDWMPETYAAYFTDLHKKEKKSFRISAITPECPRLMENAFKYFSEKEVLEAMGPESAYRTLVTKTQGEFYRWDCAGNKMPQYLHDFAQKVVFRAYVHANNEVQLTKVPIDTASIKVRIGGRNLSSDKWEYRKDTNRVIIHWHLIDISQIKPGDMIEVEYRVS